METKIVAYGATNNYSEAQELDLFTDADVKLNYSVGDITQADKKRSEFSRTIVLPGTRKNLLYFSQIYGPGVVRGNFNPKVRVNASVFRDGKEVMNGYMRLYKVTHGTYEGDMSLEVNIIGKTADFIQEIGAKTLPELDLSRYNHTYELDSVLGSWGPGGKTVASPSLDGFIFKDGSYYENLVRGTMQYGTLDRYIEDGRLQVQTVSGPHGLQEGDVVYLRGDATYGNNYESVVPTGASFSKSWWTQHWSGCHTVIKVRDAQTFVVNVPYYYNWNRLVATGTNIGAEWSLINNTATPMITVNPGQYPESPLTNFTCKFYKVSSTGEGYVYPMINRRKSTTTKTDWRFDSYTWPNTSGAQNETPEWLPATYVKTVVDAIFSEAGYSYESDFFDSEFFKRLIVPWNGTNLNPGTIFTTSLVSLSPPDATGQMTLKYNETTESRNGRWKIEPVTGGVDQVFADVAIFWNRASDGDHRGVISFDSDTVIKVNETTIYNISFAADLENNAVRPGYGEHLTTLGNRGDHIPFILNIVDSVTNNVVASMPYKRPGYKHGQINIGTGVNLSTRVKLEANKVYKINYTFDYRTWILIASGPDFDKAAQIDFASNYGVTNQAMTLVPIAAVRYGDVLNISNFLPKIKCSDFITELFRMFNLYSVTSDSGEKTLRIEPYNEFFTDDAIDWTQKLDTSRPFDVLPVGLLTDRVFKYAYKEDSDDNTTASNEKYQKLWLETIGTASKDTQTEPVSSEKTIELLSSPTPLGSFDVSVDGDGTTANPRIGWYFAQPWMRYATVEPNQKFNWRILYYQGTRYSHDQLAVNAGGTAAGGSLTYTRLYPFAGQQDSPQDPTLDLGFEVPLEVYVPTLKWTQNNLFNRFYNTKLQTVANRDAKLVRGYFYLTEKDINELDFRKTIVVDGISYVLNQVINYDAYSSQPTQVELYTKGIRYVPDIYGSSIDVTQDELGD